MGVSAGYEGRGKEEKGKEKGKGSGKGKVKDKDKEKDTAVNPDAEVICYYCLTAQDIANETAETWRRTKASRVRTLTNRHLDRQPKPTRGIRERQPGSA